jgi:hypothetical protein
MIGGILPMSRQLKSETFRNNVLFAGLGLFVMGPLMLPGHIFAIDSPISLNRDIAGYVFGTSDGPQSAFAATYTSAPIAFIHQVLGLIAPEWVVEKLWLLLLLFLSGVGASRLPGLRGIGAAYAGVLYTINPFTYSRFITGQWGMLGAYALLPFLVSSFSKLLAEPSGRNAVKVAMWLTLIGMMQLQGLVLGLIVLLVFTTFHVGRRSSKWRAQSRAMALTAALFIGLNILWLTRFLMAGDGATQNMSVGEMAYFAANPATDVLLLGGFWLDEAYLQIGDLIPAGRALAGPILFLSLFGLVAGLGSELTRRVCLALGLLVVIAFLLAAGPGMQITRPFFEVIWENIPWYRAFRDSSKFVALIAIAYAYLGGIGLSTLLSGVFEARRNLQRFVGAAALVVPILYALPMIGTWNQLEPGQFPSDWGEVRGILNAVEDQDFNVLVLPWHMYMDFEWLPNRWKRMANPAPNYFDQQTISGDNIGLVIGETNSTNPVSRYIEKILDDESVVDLGAGIAPLNARYVVAYRGIDVDLKGLLNRQRDLEVVFSGPTIALYRNTRPTSRAFKIQETELRGHDPRNCFPAPGAGCIESGGTESAELRAEIGGESSEDVVRVRPVGPLTYRVDSQEGDLVAFSLPQRTVRGGWEHNNESVELSKRINLIFRGSTDRDDVTFTRFYYRDLITYALTLVSLLVCVLIYIRGNYGRIDILNGERRAGR